MARFYYLCLLAGSAAAEMLVKPSAHEPDAIRIEDLPDNYLKATVESLGNQQDGSVDDIPDLMEQVQAFIDNIENIETDGSSDGTGQQVPVENDFAVEDGFPELGFLPMAMPGFLGMGDSMDSMMGNMLEALQEGAKMDPNVNFDVAGDNCTIKVGGIEGFDPSSKNLTVEVTPELDDGSMGAIIRIVYSASSPSKRLRGSIGVTSTHIVELPTECSAQDPDKSKYMSSDDGYLIIRIPKKMTAIVLAEEPTLQTAEDYRVIPQPGDEELFEKSDLDQTQRDSVIALRKMAAPSKSWIMRREDL